MKRILYLLVGLSVSLTSLAQPATTTRPGFVKPGTGLAVTTDGTISVTATATASGVVAYSLVSTYAAMLNIGTPTTLTYVLVANDEDKSKVNQEYDLWPNGVRIFNGTNDKLVDYSAVGSATSDGGGPWANDYSQSYDKVFDGNISTYYRSNNQNPWVGRDLGSSKYLNRVVLTPIQSSDATYLNGAQVQYSTDGSNWTNIGSAISGVTTANYTTPITVNFTTTQARYWRIQLTNYGWLAEMQLLLSRS